MNLSSALLIFGAHTVTDAFTVVHQNRRSSAPFIARTSTGSSRPVVCLKAECESRDGKDPSPDDDKEDKNKNPYELEFIDYDDPNYVTDQGLVEGEEDYNPMLSKDKTEEEIEKMREERRVQNDIFQFNVSYYFSVYFLFLYVYIMEHLREIADNINNSLSLVDLLHQILGE